MQRDSYRAAIEGAGLRIRSVRDNAGYQFIFGERQRRAAKVGR